MAKRNGMDNLQPFGTLSEERQREIRSMGGKAAQKKKREQKQLKEILTMLLYEQNVDNPEIDNWTAVNVALLNKALKGDIKAFEVLRDTLGQKQADKVDATIDTAVNINIDVGE